MKHHVYYCSLLKLFVVGICHPWDAPIVDIQTAVKMLIETWYPNGIEFNRSCLVEGCPGLNNFTMCPAEVDENRLNTLLDIICGCMRGPICGITIDKRPVMEVKVPIDDLLLGTSIKGFVSTVTGSGQLSNVSNIKLELVPGQTGGRLPFQVILHIPEMRARGQADFVIDFPVELSTNKSQRLQIHFPNVTYDATYEFFGSVSLNQSSNSSRIEIEFKNPIIKASYEYCGLDVPVGLPNFVQQFTRLSKELVEKSQLAIAEAKFMKKLLQSVIDVASNNCSE